MKRNRYTLEFKKQAIDLAESMGSVPKAATQLGIGEDIIYSWRKLIGRNPRGPNGMKADQALLDKEELLRLRRENAELKKVNYVLKAAAAFFSQDHLK
jgi:transposase-like protein